MSWLFTYEAKPKTSTVVLIILWIGIVVIGSELIYMLFHTKPENIPPLTGAIAILLSAAVASASVMKNIAETKAHDLAKSEKEKVRKRAYAFAVMSIIENQLSSFISNHKHPNENCKENYQKQVNEIKKYIKSVFDADIFPYLTDTQQKDISNFYQEFVHFKSFTVDAPGFCATATNDQQSAIKELQEYLNKSKTYIDTYKPSEDLQ